MRKFNKRDFFILALIIGFYLFWELRYINLPALRIDEAWIASISYRTLKNLSLRECVHCYLTIFRRSFPILSAPYQLSGLSYLLIPFILVGGLNVISIRIFSIFFGLLSLLLLFSFCKKFLNCKAALIIVFLTAIDWSFICGTKLGIESGVPAPVFLTTSLLCFYNWYRYKKWFYFLVGCSLVGFGLWTEAWFLWYVIALVSSYLIFIKLFTKKFSSKEIIISLILGLLSFCMMLSPLMYTEVKSHFGLTRYMINNFRYTDSAGINNLQYLKHLSYRFRQLIELPAIFCEWTKSVSTNKSYQFIVELTKPVHFCLFVVSIIWHMTMVALKKKRFLKQKRVLLVLFFLMFLQTPFTMTNFKHTHLLLLLPIIKILSGLFLLEIMDITRSFKIWILSVLVVLLFMNSYGLINYYYVYEKITGVGIDSDMAIYKVVDYLVSKGTRGELITTNSNLSHLILVISSGKIKGKNFNFNVKFNQRVGEELENRDNVFLFRSQEFGLVKCFDLFLELAQRKNKQVREIQRFYQRGEQLAYLLYEVY